ncbi:MAG: lysylphosphatidylglycerol synthase transmembrane domain-containing protein [Rhodothermales bacterium]
MPARLRRLLVQLGGFALGGVLLYLALRGVDFAAVGVALRQADYRWLLPFAAITLLSHLLRAWRWQVLLEALPVPPSASPRISLRTSFYSLMIGYAVNAVVPRVGELVRATNLTKREDRPLSGVLGTVFVGRTLDTLVVALALLSVFGLFFDRFAIIEEVFLEPALAQLGRLPLLLLVGVGIGVVVLLGVGWWLVVRQSGRPGGGWQDRVRPALETFKAGLLTVVRARQRGVLVGTTVAMWFCYTLMAYIPLVMLDLTEPYGLSLLDAYGIMVLGSLGVAVPSPGGAGSYHYVAVQTLVHLFSVPTNPAVAYAVITHAAQQLLFILTGVACWLLQGARVPSVKEAAEVEPEVESVPGKAR